MFQFFFFYHLENDRLSHIYNFRSSLQSHILTFSLFVRRTPKLKLLSCSVELLSQLSSGAPVSIFGSNKELYLGGATRGRSCLVMELNSPLEKGQKRPCPHKLFWLTDDEKRSKVII